MFEIYCFCKRVRKADYGYFYRQFNTPKLNFYVPPRPWGEWGHLDLLWFPITQICVGRPSERISAKLYLDNIFDTFSPMAFKFSDMVTMGNTLNWFNISWPCLNLLYLLLVKHILHYNSKSIDDSTFIGLLFGLL